MYYFFILRLFVSCDSFFCFIFVYSVCVSFFLSTVFIFSFFLCRSLDFPDSHHIPKRSLKKKQKSKIQTPKSRSKSVEAYTCLPNTCVCPPVCPTASSPKAQTFEPPLTIHFDEQIGLFAPYFFSCHQSCGVLHGILVHDRSPPRSRTISFLQIHQHRERNVKLAITKKSLQSSAHKH